MRPELLLREKSLRGAVLRALMAPLAGLHFIGLELYLLPYRLGVRKRFRLPVPVVSIGNITSGGTGKTPMAVLVGRLLRAQGCRVALLSRGHGGSHERAGGAQLVSRGDGSLLLTAEVAGDEPTLLAQLLPDVPVIVGRDRRISGQLACTTLAPEVLLLDDALQFWQLHRDLDIVLLDAREPFDNGWLLPRGLLREPPFHLARAGVVVLTRADRVSDQDLEQTLASVRRLAPRAALFTATHAPQCWVSLSGEERPLEFFAGATATAFAGIADSLAFRDTLESLGVTLAAFHAFGDHHAYQPEELEALLSGPHAELFLTTEKDLARLKELWQGAKDTLWALRIQLALDDLPGFEAALRERTGCRHAT